MSIYTKKGDQGLTEDEFGRAVSKADPVIEVYGAFDELNVFLGFASIALQSLQDLSLFSQKIERIQSQLLNFNSKSRMRCDLKEAVINLEKDIDVMEKDLPVLHDFILPGGSEVASRLHLARVSCRRTERLLVRYQNEFDFAPEAIVYLNRLADWLYVGARFLMVNH